MHSFSVLLASLLVSPLFANAFGHGNALTPAHKRHRNRAPSTYQKKRATYTLEDMYTGDSFVNDWSFYSEADPTHGTVNYLAKEDAIQAGLAVTNNNGPSTFAVDNSTWLGSGQGRNSVRITSNKQYNGGLFIADFEKMPTGCSTWPAFWLVGPSWPNGGEIDIVEGVNVNTKNQYTLHTGSGCTLDATLRVSTGNVLGSNCVSSNGDNSGCAYTDPSENSYGAGFNDNNGGVYATVWDSEGISMYFFSRCDIPEDIDNETPDPSSWGSPVATFPFTSCTADHFSDMSMVLDTTLCGDWAGGATGSGDCPKSCNEYVMDPTNFATAAWEVNYIAVYQS